MLHFVLLKNIQNTKYNINDGKKPEQATTIKINLPEPVVIANSPGYA
jgi:hypothetical protein